MYLPSGKLEAKKSCSDFSKASLKMGFKGTIAEGPLDLSSCWPFSSSRPSTEVEDLGKVSLEKTFERKTSNTAQIKLGGHNFFNLRPRILS